jgi:uncharacterized membrane protein
VNSMRVWAVILLIVAIAALVLGVVYFTVAADKLPSFLGHSAHARGHRTKRGLAALVAGGVLVLGSIAAFFRARAQAQY